MNRYRVELTVGDEFGYNKAGDVFYIGEDEVEETLINGYRYFKCFHKGEDGAVFFYPCKVFKEQYQLISTAPLGTSNSEKISVELKPVERGWEDRWP